MSATSVSSNPAKCGVGCPKTGERPHFCLEREPFAGGWRFNRDGPMPNPNRRRDFRKKWVHGDEIILRAPRAFVTMGNRVDGATHFCSATCGLVRFRFGAPVGSG